MEDYVPFLIPLEAGIHPAEISSGITSPLEEEMWLVSRPGITTDWKALAERCHDDYGLELLCDERQLVPGSYSLQEQRPDDVFRLIKSNDSSGLFVMEHPSQLPQFDATGTSNQRPVLAKPSLFAKWTSGSNQTARNEYIHSASPVQPEDSIMAFNNTIQQLIEDKPTDWHLVPTAKSYRSQIRLNGMLTEATEFPLRKGRWLTNSLKAACGMEQAGSFGPLDGSFNVDHSRYRNVCARISIIPSLYGQAIAARFLYNDQMGLRTLDELGMTLEQKRLIDEAACHQEGLWIVSGPTGSGKSTTLHTLVRSFVDSCDKVITVEDPVEKTIPGAQQVSVNRKTGITCQSALKAFMRQAPDTILIGEIRDPETAAIAIQSAFSGHRILTTLHAGDNHGIIMRLQDFKISKRLIQSAITLTIHQRLVPILCKSCKTAVKLPVHIRDAFIRNTGVAILHVPSASGCMDCKNGYFKRTGIFNVSQLSENPAENHQFQERAIDLLETHEIDLQSAIPFLPEAIYCHLRHFNCKDFANY